MFFAPEGLQGVHDDHALRVEEGEAWALVMDREEVKLFAEFAVVARLSLFQAAQIGLEFVLRAEGRPVDARKHLVFLIAVPVGPRERKQLEEFAAAGMRYVRAAAEVHEVPFGVYGERLALYALDEFDLEVLAHRGELFHRLLFGKLAAYQRDLLLRYPAHLGLDLRQVVLRDRLREADIVIEAVFYRGADAELRLGIEAQHGVREKMRRRMAQKVKPLLAVGEERRKDRILREYSVAVHGLAADRGPDRLFQMPYVKQLAHCRALRLVAFTLRC